MRFYAVRYAFGLVLLGWGLTGCMKDNPVHDKDHSAHVVAVGLVIFQEGEVLVRYEAGVVSGSLFVRVGEQTPNLEVHFIDQRTGNLFVPELAHHTVVYRIADEGVAAVHSREGTVFVLRGLRPGRTVLEIRILHGDHADFVSAPIPVEVVA